MPVPLSIVVSSRTPWPHIQPTLAAIVREARTVGAEIIVADGCGRALPEPLVSPYDEVVWLKVPDAGAFGLRAAAVARARAPVVAITEDHTIVRPGWCRRILQVHAEHPSAVAVGGAVENASTEHLRDWAGFFIANSPFLLPLQNGETERISLQANISYKRRVLERAGSGDLGLMEMLLNRELREQNQTLVADDRIVVDHVQGLSLGTFCVLHFHNGRSIAGYRLPRMSAFERIVRLGGCAILPPVMLARTLGTVMQKRRLVGLAFACVPLMTLMLCCHAAGECVGYITGPGESPRYKHIG